MAVTGFLHHIGTFLLFISVIFLVITCISAPVVHNISILRVNLGDGSAGSGISFGTFGWCVFDAIGKGNDRCSRSMIGYNPAQIVNEADGTSYSDYAERTAESLSKVMILHPIAAGVAFIAFLMSLGAGMFGSLLSALISTLAFLMTVVVLITDFVLFAIISSNINGNNDGGNDDSYAYYSAGIWTILVAAICLLFGTIIVFFTCCSGRLHKRRQQRTKVDTYSTPVATTHTRRRWWSRRRY